MKFRFPLQKVLEHRKTIESIAQRDFQEAQAILGQNENDLAQMIQELHEARMSLGKSLKSGPGGGPERLKQIYDYSVLQDLRIKKQRAKVEESRDLVEAKREILRERAVETKIMERLKERRKEEFLHHEKMLDQKETDEINVLRFDAKDGE